MKKLFIIPIVFLFATASAQNAAPSLKSLLLDQLKTTHNVQDWFVPLNQSLAGLSFEQANWKDKDNHSVGELATHLLFWNKQQLAGFKGEKPESFDGDNKKTFADFTKESWASIVKQEDEVLTEMEKLIEKATDAQLAKWAKNISHISTHNAYHVGQIIYIRKVQGSWDAEKGVK